MSASTDLGSLLAEIDAALEHADDDVRSAWERIRIAPEKWQCSPWGDEGGGFWAFAEFRGKVIWYNDIEGGFNESTFSARGVIDEYWCNQSDFATILGNLPDAVMAENYAAEAPASSVPETLLVPGCIERRQTTFWELRSSSGRLVRVHFSGKAEARFSSSSYQRVEITDAHPLLAAFHESWVSVFVAGVQGAGQSLIHSLRSRVDAATGGWRSLDEYLARGGPTDLILTSGDGLLLRAPKSVAELAQAVVQEHGASATLVGGWKEGNGNRVLLLDQSFVIAQAFRFQVL